MTSTKTIEDWLKEAWAESRECPPPEIFLPSEWEEMTDTARQRASRHLESCPACAAERDLAISFDAEPLANPRADEQIEAILQRVIGPAKDSRAGARVLGFPPRARLLPRRALALVAAAMVVLVAGLVVRGRVGPPVLPDGPVGDVVRSARLEVVAPVGDVAAPPRAFRWTETEGAARYLATLSGVDGEVLWSADADAPSVVLPAEVRSGLRARSVYFLEVEAFDAEGIRLARSEPTAFRPLSGTDGAGE